jgi:nicotinamide mononucleotide adenylyltransferase
MNDVVFTFGRFNPPTKGHVEIINEMKRISNHLGCSYRVYTSQKEDNKINPLPYDEKVKFIEIILGVKIEKSNSIISIFDVIKDLSNDGYKNLIMVVGSDRKRIFEKKLLHYVGSEFDIDSLKIVSVDRSKIENTSIEGISSKQMRQFAKSNNFQDFCIGLPKNIHISDSKQLFKEVQKGLLHGRKNTSNMVQ